MYELTERDLSRYSIDWCIATHNELKADDEPFKRLSGVHGPVMVTRESIRAEITRRSPEVLECLR